MDKRRATMGIATVGAVLAGFGVLQVVGGDGSPLGPSSAAADDHLVPYSSCEALRDAYRGALQETATAYGWDGGGRYAVDDMMERSASASGSADMAAAAPQAADKAAAVGSGATGTNVQERGVDEPDIAKVLDGRLVTLTGGALQVLTAGPVPVKLGRLALPQGGATELLLDGDRALVIEPGYQVYSGPTGVAVDVVAPGAATSSSSGSEGSGSSPAVPPSEAPPDGPTDPQQPEPPMAPKLPVDAGRTTLRLADLSDPAHPRWVESWSIDGAYVSARLVDGTVRLVTTTSPRPEVVTTPRSGNQVQELAARLANRKAAGELTVDQLLPRTTRLDAAGKTLSDGRGVACEAVSYAPVADGADLTVVTSLRPSAGLTPIGSTGMTAPGDLVYASAGRLVVATSRWQKSSEQTQLHSFDTSDPSGQVRYVASGSLPGHVLGRWAFSYAEGVLRVATTSSGSAGPSASSVTTLRESGKDLVVAGTVGGLGRGEQIKAVRYLGDLAVVVTFRQTDPLYVLDLADPAAPVLKGELKIPGFSTYLHPVGDDRLLGIGMEADARTGRTTGMQASLFDLADLAHPTQLSRLDLGEGWSPALEDSRAFAYDPEHRLALLPVETYSSTTGNRTFSGAVGFTVGADGVLTRIGQLAVGGSGATRVLVAGDTVLAVGERSVVAADAGTLAATGSVSL